MNLRALTRTERLFLGLFAAYYLFGAVSNYTRTSPAVPQSVSQPIQFLSMLLMAAWIVFFVWSLATRRYSVTDLGFRLRSRPAVAMTVVAAAIAVVAFLRLPSLAHPWLLGLVVSAVLVEEILFRPLLISLLSNLFARAASPLFVATVVAAVLWALPHLASKPPSQVFGIFVGGLLFGCAYVLSGTNVFAFVLHSAANAGGVGAILALAVCVLLPLVPGPRQAISPQST